MSDKSIKAGKSFLNHIFSCNELLICLVCKENIKGEVSFDHDTLLLYHTNTKKHKKNVRSLFKLCIPMWSGCYADIIKNLVFDVILERNEPSFVLKTGDDFTCLVCQANIAQGTDSKATTIINHIKQDTHLNNLKHRVSWVYPVHDKLAFLIFDNSEVYCFMCKQDLQQITACPLRRAMDHFKVCHKIMYKILAEQQNNEPLTDDKSDSPSLKYLTLSDNIPPSANDDSSNRILIPELSFNTCEWEADVFICSEKKEVSNASIDICVNLKSDKVSEKSFKAEKKSFNHIFIDDKLLICLVCKKNIKGELNVDRDTHFTNHTNSKKHQKNVRSLFMLCVPTWCGSYAEIVKNLQFDVILERNELSFISKTGNEFICLVCQENIALSTNAIEITTSIINHIGTDFHLNNLKNGISWVYNLGDELGFIMLHKTEVYCSICNEQLQNLISCPLKRAVKHFKVHHKIGYQIFMEQQNNESLTDDKSICQSLSNVPSASSSSSYTVLDSKLSLDTCDGGKGSQSNPVNDCADVLMCPDCGEVIEIYNENVDFSMDLHMLKHKPLESVNTESSLDYQDNADYVCPICQETIQIFNKNLQLSIDLHFEENVHEHERFTSTGDDDKSRFDFFSRVFDCLSEDMRNQQSVFLVNGNEVLCKVCNCVVSLSTNVPDACTVLTDHVLSTFHVDQLTASSQFLTTAVLNFKQSLPQSSAIEQDNIFKKLCKQDAVIEDNKQFIEKRQIGYCCTVCDKQISYSPNENMQALNFVSHLNGESHKKSLKKCKLTVSPNSQRQDDIAGAEGGMPNIFLQSSKESLALKLNQPFIKVKNGNLFCEICQVLIKFSETGSDLQQHLASLLHITELSVRGLRYLSKLDYKELTEEYKKVLNCVIKESHFKPHEPYINHNGENFFCIICNVSISGSANTGKNVQKHLSSMEHREKFFDVVLSQECCPKELKNKDKSTPFLSANTR